MIKRSFFSPITLSTYLPCFDLDDFGLEFLSSHMIDRGGYGAKEG